MGLEEPSTEVVFRKSELLDERAHGTIEDENSAFEGGTDKLIMRRKGGRLFQSEIRTYGVDKDSGGRLLVSAEDVARVDFVFNIVEDGVISVGDYRLASPLEVVHVVDDQAAEECGAVGQSRFVD